jgi:hypothetical protein
VDIVGLAAAAVALLAGAVMIADNAARIPASGPTI